MSVLYRQNKNYTVQLIFFYFETYLTFPTDYLLFNNLSQLFSALYYNLLAWLHKHE